jgi:transcription antitermination factor NusG
MEKELVTDSKLYKTYVVKDLKYPIHAYCIHNETGMVVEQVSQMKSHAIRLAETEMKHRIKNGEVKA